MLLSVMSRRQVLQLYKKLIQTGKTWEAKDPKHTQEERNYILNQTRKIFKKNLDVPKHEVKNYLLEGEARLGIGKGKIYLFL